MKYYKPYILRVLVLSALSNAIIHVIVHILGLGDTALFSLCAVSGVVIGSHYGRRIHEDREKDSKKA